MPLALMSHSGFGAGRCSAHDVFLARLTPLVRCGLTSCGAVMATGAQCVLCHVNASCALWQTVV